MNIARFNFSHGDHEYHKGTLDNLRIASKNLGIRCGVLLDTKGPEIRTGMLDHGEPVFLEKDSEITLTTDYECKGNKNLIAVSYSSLAKDVAPGSQILCADGSITFTVLSCDVDAGTGPGAMREQRQARRAQEHEPPRRQRRPSHHHGEGPRRHPQLGRQEQG
jgi:pyruvate kinase